MNSDARCPNCFADTAGEDPCPHCGLARDAPRPANALRLGTVLRDQYVVGRVLGKPGGFGVTYLALDRDLAARVAIKEYLPRDFATRSADRASVVPNVEEGAGLFGYGLEQFSAEAQTLAQLDHPNIVRVRQLFRANGSAYLVMDYYQGMTLAEYLHAQPDGRLPEDKAIALMQPVLDGLRAVHAKGFLHRDIKPSNVYLAKTDAGGVRPILLDFGAARQVLAERSRSITTVLTPGYAPFEQYHDKGKQGTWTDVYAAAAVLYRMLSGTTPPEATARMDEDELLSAAELGVSKMISQALQGALTLRAAERTQDVSTFQQGLLARVDAAQTETTTSAPLDYSIDPKLLRGPRRFLGQSPGDHARTSGITPGAQEHTPSRPPEKQRIDHILKLRFLGAKDAHYGLLLLLITPITFLLSILLTATLAGFLSQNTDFDSYQSDHLAATSAAVILAATLYQLLGKAHATFSGIRYSGFFGGLALSNWFTIPLFGLTGIVLGATYKQDLAGLNFLPWLFWQSGLIVDGAAPQFGLVVADPTPQGGLVGFTWQDLQLSWIMAIALIAWFIFGVSMDGKRQSRYSLVLLANLAINVTLTLMAIRGFLRSLESNSNAGLDLWANFLCFALFGGASAFLIAHIWTGGPSARTSDIESAR
jgi:serine/threonine protein kinase